MQKIVRKMRKYHNTKRVAEICECSLSHVQTTWKKYKEGGVEAIKAVKMGRPQGSGSRLTTEQESKIKKLITKNMPEEVNLCGYLWERKTIPELINQQFGIKMPLSTTGDYLAKWKFAYQRPKKHYKQDEKVLKQWISVTYPKIAKQATIENAEIYWTDDVGIQNTTNYVKGYAPIGKTPTVPVATKHIRVNMISTMTNKGRLEFQFYSEKMNQDCFKDFLINLIASTDKKSI